MNAHQQRTLASMKALCNERGLLVSGSNQQLADRLVDWEEEMGKLPPTPNEMEAEARRNRVQWENRRNAGGNDTPPTNEQLGLATQFSMRMGIPVPRFDLMVDIVAWLDWAATYGRDLNRSRASASGSRV